MGEEIFFSASPSRLPGKEIIDISKGIVSMGKEISIMGKEFIPSASPSKLMGKEIMRVSKKVCKWLFEAVCRKTDYISGFVYKLI